MIADDFESEFRAAMDAAKSRPTISRSDDRGSRGLVVLAAVMVTLAFWGGMFWLVSGLWGGAFRRLFG